MRRHQGLMMVLTAETSPPRLQLIGALRAALDPVKSIEVARFRTGSLVRISPNRLNENACARIRLEVRNAKSALRQCQTHHGGCGSLWKTAHRLRGQPYVGANQCDPRIVGKLIVGKLSELRGVNLLSPTLNLRLYEIIDILGFVLPNYTLYI